MHVAPQSVLVFANDEHRFGVHLLVGKAVDDVRAGALQAFCPLDVVLFVEARLELDDDGDLFLVLGGREQRANDRRVLSRRSVERRLDGENLRILGRLRYELNDRIERLVRMVQQDVAFANLREDVGGADQTLGNRRLERLVAQIVVAREVNDLPQVAERN